MSFVSNIHHRLYSMLHTIASFVLGHIECEKDVYELMIDDGNESNVHIRFYRALRHLNLLLFCKQCMNEVGNLYIFI